MSKSNTTARIGRNRRLLAVSVTAAMVGTPNAHAFERVVIGFEHFIDCAGLLLTDTERHAQNCLPNNAPPDIFKWESESTAYDSVAPPPPPPKGVVAPGDCGPADCGPADCGPADCGPADT